MGVSTVWRAQEWRVGPSTLVGKKLTVGNVGSLCTEVVGDAVKNRVVGTCACDLVNLVPGNLHRESVVEARAAISLRRRERERERERDSPHLLAHNADARP